MTAEHMTQTSMTQTGIPFLFLRGGSSRGPYMNRADLPADLDRLADVLVAAVGSGHPLNIDGIGGGSAVTTKVCLLYTSPSPRDKRQSRMPSSA